MELKDKKKPPKKLDNALFAEMKWVATELIKNQQPLGDEFTKVLHDNRWDLYE